MVRTATNSKTGGGDPVSVRLFSSILFAWPYRQYRSCNEMPKAYVIAHVTFTNREKFMADYGSKVEATVNAFGGQFLVRGGEVSYQEGEALGDINVVIEFPDRAAAISWEESEQYQAILPGRTDNSAGNVAIVDGV